MRIAPLSECSWAAILATGAHTNWRPGRGSDGTELAITSLTAYLLRSANFATSQREQTHLQSSSLWVKLLSRSKEEAFDMHRTCSSASYHRGRCLEFSIRSTTCDIHVVYRCVRGECLWKRIRRRITNSASRLVAVGRLQCSQSISSLVFVSIMIIAVIDVDSKVRRDIYP